MLIQGGRYILLDNLSSKPGMSCYLFAHAMTYYSSLQSIGDTILDLVIRRLTGTDYIRADFLPYSDSI